MLLARPNVLEAQKRKVKNAEEVYCCLGKMTEQDI
jgi:hypothetical protein